MKTVETIKTGKNFTAVSVGKLNEIKDYVLPMGDIEIPGKVFVGQALQATGSELSFQVLVPNQDSGFLHTHTRHTRNFTSFLKVKGNIKLMEKYSQYRKAVLFV